MRLLRVTSSRRSVRSALCQPKGLKSQPLKKSIPYQSGQLECDQALVGSSTFKPVPDNDNFQINIRYTVWQHEKVPTGVAGLKMEVTFKQKGNVAAQAEMTFDVQDFGKGAKSTLPDKN